MLSLVALKLGASAVVAIESDKQELSKARAHLTLNGFKENQDYYLVQRDLNQPDDLVSEIGGRVALSQSIVIISNIGDWDDYTREIGNDFIITNNLTVIRLMDAIKSAGGRVVSFIAGGYKTSDSVIHRASSSVLDRDADVLEKKGFSVTFLASMNKTTQQASSALAFAAHRRTRLNLAPERVLKRAL